MYPDSSHLRFLSQLPEASFKSQRCVLPAVASAQNPPITFGQHLLFPAERSSKSLPPGGPNPHPTPPLSNGAICPAPPPSHHTLSSMPSAVLGVGRTGVRRRRDVCLQEPAQLRHRHRGEGGPEQHTVVEKPRGRAGLDLCLKASAPRGNITELKLALLCSSLAGKLWDPVQTAHALHFTMPQFPTCKL